MFSIESIHSQSMGQTNTCNKHEKQSHNITETNTDANNFISTFFKKPDNEIIEFFRIHGGGIELSLEDVKKIKTIEREQRNAPL